jgi:hypothetical protein
MNERIRELADQCRTEYHDGHGGFTEQFDEEKFAELIVRECANISNENVKLGATYYTQVLDEK